MRERLRVPLWLPVLMVLALPGGDLLIHGEILWALMMCAAVGVLLLVWRADAAQSVSAVCRRLSFVEGASHEASWECDPKGRITYGSELFASYFGLRASDLPGKPLTDLLSPEDHPKLACLLAATSGWRNVRFRCVSDDGGELWMEGSGVAVVGPHGRLLGFTGSCHPFADEADSARLNRILARVRSAIEEDTVQAVFQPIVSVHTGRCVGAEALARFPTPDALPPDVWFSEAAEVGLGVQLELNAVQKALAGACALPVDIYISVNVSPSTLATPDLLETVLAGPIPPSRVVVEVTEHVGVGDYDDLREPVRRLREHGVRLAVDDAGAGYASFRHILWLAPEFIKLDRSLVAGIDQDPALRALAAAVVMFGLEMNAQIIAEGIETMAEMRTAQLLGIDCGQGYLLGRPTADWTTWSEWHAAGPLYRLDRTATERSVIP